MKNMTYEELVVEIDMLKGNINRICITNDYEEALKMYNHGRQRLAKIMKYNLDRIKANRTSEQIEEKNE